jgi:hypothetical protein
MSDIVNSILKREKLFTNPYNLKRDYVHPEDLYSLVCLLLFGNKGNVAIDSYSLAPVDKFPLLDEMVSSFGLEYEVISDAITVNATGQKLNYFSKNRVAKDFGYQPRYSSLAGLHREVETILLRNKI